MTDLGAIQLIVPMAGLGTRFTNAGYTTAKPLLPIHGQPMFMIVLGNLVTDQVSSITIIAQKSWNLQSSIAAVRETIPQKLNLIEIDYVTGGPAETVSLARDFIDPSMPVVTANSDQYVAADLHDFYRKVIDPSVAGTILTMQDNDPKWSYAATDGHGHVTLVREKEVISSNATVGIYGYRTGELMFTAFNAMKAAQAKVNNEYYVAPSYNFLISQGEIVDTIDLGLVSTVMFGLGIPEDYEAFLTAQVSRFAAVQAARLVDG